MKKFKLSFFLLLFPILVFCQERTLSGTVTDEAGEPLPGVSVVVKGTSTGTVTDFDGLYELNVPEDENKIVQYSYIGFSTQEIAVENQSTIDVALTEDVAALDEVVVVGYGTQKKESLTAAVSNISGEAIETTTNTSLAQKLTGKVAGLQIRQQSGQPGDLDNAINIRGFGEPIYVIDGIRRGGSRDFQQLNAEDIESISVLKDAAAAIYGLGASNGVILVTTKKGKSGRPSFTFNTVTGTVRPTDVPEMATAAQYTQMWNDAQIFKPFGDEQPFYSQEEIENWKDGGPGYESTDWYDEVMKKSAFQRQYNLSASGGNERTNYFMSMGYTNEEGLLKSGDMGYERYNLRSNITTELTKNLKGELLIGGVWSKRWQPGTGFFNIFKGTRVSLPIERPYANNNPDFPAPVSSGLNPVAFAERDLTGYNEDKERNFTSSFALTYTAPFLEGLSFKGVAAYDMYNFQNKGLSKPYNLWTYDETEDSYNPIGQRTGTGNISNSNTNSDGITLQAFVNFERTFDEKHDVSATVVMESNRFNQRFSRVQRFYGSFYTKDQIRFADQIGQESDGIETETSDLSYIGRLNYAFGGKYLFEVAARYMGSYRYAPSNRWGFYPTGSVGWLVSEENFLKDKTAISNLKLRASYGVSAMPEGGAFQYIEGYSLGSGGSYEFVDGVLTNGISSPIPANDNLSWMTATTTDIGLDLGLWKNRFTFTTDVYQRLLEGIPARRSIALPNTYGGELPEENLNSELAQGIEFSAAYRDNKGDFQYNVSANFAFNRTKNKHIEGEVFTNSMERWRNQRSDRWNDINWGYTYIGQFQNEEELRFAPLQNGDQGNIIRELPGDFRYADINDDGIIDGQDETPLFYGATPNDIATDFYRPTPNFNYGLTLDLSFKRFYMNMLWQGAAQYTVRFREVYAEMFAFRGNTPAYFYDRWTKADPYDPNSEWIPGEWPASRTIGDVGRMYAESNRWRRDASYLRLKSLEFGYNIESDALLSGLGVKNLRIFASAFNLLTFADPFVKPFDPEKIEGAFSAGLNYPLTQTFNLGLNINF